MCWPSVAFAAAVIVSFAAFCSLATVAFGIEMPAIPLGTEAVTVTSSAKPKSRVIETGTSIFSPCFSGVVGWVAASVIGAGAILIVIEVDTTGTLRSAGFAAAAKSVARLSVAAFRSVVALARAVASTAALSALVLASAAAFAFASASPSAF